MAIVRKSNTMTAVKKSNVAGVYQEFIRSRKNLCAPSTLNIYQELGDRYFINSLARITGDDLNSLTAKDLRTLIDEYADSHSAGGTAFVYRHLKAFINWYWEEYDIARPNPIAKVHIKSPKMKPIQGIDRDGVEKILKAAKEHSTFPERDVAMLMVLCDTGVRRSSLLNLKMGDVDLDNGQLTVFEKDQSYHLKPFGTACAKAIRAYFGCLSDVKPDDPMWIKLDGCALSAFGAKEILRRLSRVAGIEEQSFHDFRRFYGLETYKATGDIYFVSRALDHKSVEVTKRYLAIDQIEDLEHARAVSPMDIRINQTGIKVSRHRISA